MSLSTDLISQFVKVTNDRTSAKKESTVYATTVKYNGKMYVRIDGSNMLTPVSTTADIEEGERVTVTIKNHTAIITGNISSPAARVEEVDKNTSDIGTNKEDIKTNTDNISKLEGIVADKATIGDLTATNAKIVQLEADNVTVNEKLTAAEGEIGTLITENVTIKGNLEAANAKIGNLETENVTVNEKLTAAEGDIDKLEAEDVTIKNSLTATEANIKNLQAEDVTIKGNLEAANAKIGNLETDNATVKGKLEAAEAEIGTLKTDKLNAKDAELTYATIQNLNATNANVSSLSADHANFKTATTETLKANQASIDELEAKKLSAEEAEIKYANIDFTNIDKAAMEYFYAQSGLIKDVTVGDQTITGELVGVTIRGDLIEGNTIKAEKLVIKGSDGLYYKLNTDGNKVETEQTDYNSINGSIITAKSITATKIAVEDLVAFGATIGGFHITEKSLYSGVKETVGNTTRGTYLDSEGQIAFGDSNNFVKFFKDTDGKYKLLISADQFKFSTGKDIATAISDVDTIAKTARDDLEVVTDRVNGLPTDADVQSAISIAKGEITSSVNATLTAYDTSAEVDSKITQKAGEITLSVNESYERLSSKGEQLIVNGNAIMGDNTNFSSFIFDGATTNSSPGSFTYAANKKNTLYTDEFFLINPQREYTLSLDLKSANAKATFYSFLAFYDVDQKQINARHSIFVPGSTTTLARDLKAGDTVAYVTDISGWTRTVNRTAMIFWNYTNSFGYTYPAETYSRNSVNIKSSSSTPTEDAFNQTAKTVTLASAYSGATIPAGTAVSQGGDGATYKYIAISGSIVPSEWTTYSGKIKGVDYSGQNKSAIFPPGVAYAKLGFLWNYNTATDQIWATNITLTDSTGLSALKEETAASLKVTNDSITALASRTTTVEGKVSTAESNISQNADNIEAVVKRTETVEGKVSTAETKINQNADSIVSLAARTDGLDESYSQISQRADQIETRVSNIKIGGRNLVAGTNETTVYQGNKGTSTQKDVWSAKTIVAPTGTEYIISFDAKADVAQNISCFFFSPNTTLTSESSTGDKRTGVTDGQSYVSITTEWKRYWVKWTQTPTDTQKNIIVGRVYTADNIYIRAVKLEEGNQATDWTPAPEDVDGNIDSVETRVTQTETDITSLATRTTNAEGRIGTAETKINQNADNIESVATRTTNAEGRIGTAESKITQNANNITAVTTRTGTLETNYSKLSADANSIRSEVGSIKIGGRNLIAGTDEVTEYVGALTSGSYKDVWTGQTIEIPTGTEYVVSFDAKADAAQEIKCFFYHSQGNTVTSATSSTGQSSTSADGNCTVSITTEWKRYWVKWTQTVPTVIKNVIVGRNFTANNVYIRAIKFEEGNKPTDWTAAPEDVNERINNNLDDINEARTLIEQLKDSISMLVTDKNGASLMTQTSEGWTFSTSTIEENLGKVSENLKTLTETVGGAQETISKLDGAIADLGVYTNYIKFTTYEDEPCIELGEAEKDYKVLITNTRIMFKVGSAIPTYIDNTGLITKKITVNEGFVQGDFMWKKRTNGNYGLSYIGG